MSLNILKTKNLRSDYKNFSVLTCNMCFHDFCDVIKLIELIDDVDVLLFLFQEMKLFETQRNKNRVYVIYLFIHIREAG